MIFGSVSHAKKQGLPQLVKPEKLNVYHTVTYNNHDPRKDG